MVATLSIAGLQPVTVNLGFAGTATLGTDYSRSAAQIVIPAGQLSGSVTVSSINDLVDEVNETVFVTVDSVINGVENGNQQASVVISGRRYRPRGELDVIHNNFSENNGITQVIATLSQTSALDVTVTLAYSGSALFFDDYVRDGSVIVIPAGQLSGSVSLTGIDDGLIEGNEFVVIDVVNVGGGTENGTQQVTATIADDDVPSVNLSIFGSSIAENGGGATITAFTSTPVLQAMTVFLAFSGTAAVGNDYQRSGTQIVIPIGQTAGSITLTGVNDLLDENSESIVVDISSVTGGSENGTQQVTATITDDDPPPSVSLQLSSGTLAENGGVVNVFAVLSTASGLPVTVDVALSGTATLGSDYTNSVTQVVIPAGATSASLTLTGLDDALYETGESIVVDITTVTNGSENGVQQATVTINDDEQSPRVNLQISGSSLAENGGVATITAILSAVAGVPVTVDLGFSGIAGLGSDYSRSGTQIVIPAGQLAGTITVTGLNDALDEDDEAIQVDITGVSNGTENGTQQVTVTIVDDDVPPTVSLQLAGGTIAENGGVATVTAVLSAVSGRTVTIDLAFSGTAALGPDYTRSANQIVIPAGQTAGSLSLTGINNSVFESNKTVIVDVNTVTNGTENGVQQVTTTIVNDDPAGTVALQLVGNPFNENGGTATVVAILSSVASTPVTVDLGFSGSAGFGADYTNSSNQIVIPAGQTSASITLTGLDDLLVDPNETVVVDITSVQNAIEAGIQQVTASITDNETLPIVEFRDASQSAAETAGAVTGIVKLSQTMSFDVTVPFTISGTATQGLDYTASTSAVVIVAGQTSAAITVNLLDDAFQEGNETVILTLSTPTAGTTLGTNSAVHTLTITDAGVDPFLVAGNG